MKVEKAVEHSIENVLKEGLTDIFHRPFEVDLLGNKEFRKKIFESTLKSIKGNSFESLGVSRISHVLMPKNSAFDFRRCALMHPLDTIKYLALVLLMAETIEKSRIPLSEKRVYSYRYKINNGYIFNKNYTITTFINRAREKAKQRGVKFIVSCDIANFYDRLNLHRLENILLSIGCDRTKVSVLNELLLFWSNRDSYGLPVGSNASRILAEASLIGVDLYLRDMNVDFIRFVDDYRLFAPDANTAHYWLTLLIERLWQEGLTINKSKTKIEASTEYKKREDKLKSSTENKKVGKVTNPFRIQAGYGGTVPTKFRNLSSKEAENLREVNLEEKIKDIALKEFIEAEQIIEIVKIIVSTEQYSKLINVARALDKYPQLTPYVVDALIKHSHYIDENSKLHIKEYFREKVQHNKYIPEYIILEIIRFFGHSDFSEKSILMKMFRELKRNSGAYIGRTLLEALETKVTREEAIEIRNTYDRSDLWEKRQIIRIMDRVLHDDEKRVWLKNIKSNEGIDLFLLELSNSNKKVRKKKLNER